MSTEFKLYGPREEGQGEEGDALFVGVNNRLAADKLPAGMLSDCRNGRMRTGEVVTRPGMVKPGWLNVTRAGLDAKISPVGKFYGVGVFKDPGSVEWVLSAADGSVFRHQPHNGRMELPLPSGVRVLSECSFVQAFDRVYLLRGKYLQPLVMGAVDTGFEDVLPRWDATTVWKALIVATGQAAEEVAYGPFVTVDALTSVADLATVTQNNAHGYVTGADVVIRGATEPGYNGRWNITVVDDKTFTFQFEGETSPATGAPKVSNMGSYWRALGSQVTLTTLTRVGTTATATKNGHGFTTGQYVTVSGVTPAGYNGTYVITVTGANTFTYVMAADPGAGGSGTMLARTSVVLAGQSPDTNPEAWQRIYNVLPNSDTGVYVNNRLILATAYTPGLAGYDSTSVYTKTDFLVALDILDEVHFVFNDEFRINQGGDDEIVEVVKYNQNTLLVLKGKSWGVLTGVTGDLSQVALDMRGDRYGECGPRAGAVAGRDFIFGSTARGLVSLTQNELGQMRGTDVPFSNDVEAWVKRINWTLGRKVRVAYWDDRLYAAVPLDDGVCAKGPPTAELATGLSWSSGNPARAVVTGLVAGLRYQYVAGNSGLLTDDTTPSPDIGPAGNEIAVGEFVATTDTYYLWDGPPGGVVTASVQEVVEVLAGVNNGVMVYDFRAQRLSQDPTQYDFQSGQWVSLDTGAGWCVQEWFTATYHGRERLFFIGSDGYANLVEEADAGDQAANSTSAAGLAWTPVLTDWLSRGYRLGGDGQKKWKRLELVLGVWNALLSVTRRTGAAESEVTVRAGLSFSRTKYLKPAGKADYVAGNGNGDFATPGRGDYSIPLTPALTPGAGLGIVFQEVVVRSPVRTMAGRYGQFRVTNASGRLRLKGVTPVASEGQRRSGVVV